MISNLRNYLRNLYAKFYHETHTPTVAEFVDIWNDLDNKTVEVRYLFAASVPESADVAMKKLSKEKKKKSRK